MAYIEQRKNGSVKIIVSGGYNSSGKQIRHSLTIEAIKLANLTERQKEKEIERQKVLFEQKVRNGTFLDGEKITFEEFSIKWLNDYAEKQLAPSTLDKYKNRLINRVIPAIGHIKLAKLQPHHLMEFYNNLAENGIRLDMYYKPNNKLLEMLNENTPTKYAGIIGISPKTCTAVTKGGRTKIETAEKICAYFNKSIKELFTAESKQEALSSKTIKHHHDLISTVLGTAMEWNLITTNPATRVKAPKVNKPTPQYYDDKQLLDLFQYLEYAPLKYKVAIYLTIDTGIRLSELAGLKWSDLDFDKKSLEISRQRQYVTGYGILERTPKTDSGFRNITISDTVIKLLRLYHKEQLENKLKLGSMWNENSNIFIHEDGQPLHPHRPYKWFIEFIEQNDLPKITFHQLRHTNASLLIASGL